MDICPLCITLWLRLPVLPMGRLDWGRIGHCPWTLDELTVDRRPDPKKKEAKAASKKKNGYADKGAAVRHSC